MIETRHRPRFLLEALGESFVRNLDRNNTIQPRVASFVDFTHPARADGLNNLVGSKAFTNGKRHKS